MKSDRLVPFLALVAATLVACTPAPESAQAAPAAESVQAAPTATAAVAPTATPAPVLPASQATAAPVTPAPLASPAPSAAPVATPTPGVPIAAPDAPPQILGFSISTNVVHPGDVLSGNVTASSNVASVEVRVAGFSYNMTKTEPGRFFLSAVVPNVPKMFRRTYPMVAIARNARGDATQVTTQITIQ